MKLNLEQVDSLVAILLLLLLHSKNPLDLKLVVAVCVGMRRHIAPRDTDSLALLAPYPQKRCKQPKRETTSVQKNTNVAQTRAKTKDVGFVVGFLGCNGRRPKTKPLSSKFTTGSGQEFHSFR
jgi:hypothetical protein